jgi:hypothetical protein
MLININAFPKNKFHSTQNWRNITTQKLIIKKKMALTIVVLKWQNAVSHLSSDNMNIKSMTCLKKK